MQACIPVRACKSLHKDCEPMSDLGICAPYFKCCLWQAAQQVTLFWQCDAMLFLFCISAELHCVVSKVLSTIGNCVFAGILSAAVFFLLLGRYSAYVGSCLQTLRDGLSSASTWIALSLEVGRGQLKCDSARAETRFGLSAKRTRPFKSAGGRQFSRLLRSRGVSISGSDAGYTMFRGSVKSTDYPLHSPVSPSFPLPFVTVCHHISTGLY